MKKTHSKKKVTKKTPMHWIGGGIVGAALGVGAGLLADSEVGKKWGARAYAELYRLMAPEVKKMKKVGETEYNELLAKAMQRYNKDKKLSEQEAKELMKDAMASWKHLKKNL